ncbi:MAG: hypothetical protein HPY55_13330 [Firmicutes bacterium]|nr:hypothetical protein [Bacillota bacterium]
MDPARKTVVYLCRGCGTQGSQVIPEPEDRSLQVTCPACGNSTLSRELAPDSGEMALAEVRL